MMNYGYSEKGQQGSLSDFHLWKKILHYSAPYWIGLSLAVFISILITGATLTLPHLVQTAIDNHITASLLPTEERLAGLAQTALKYGALIVGIFFASFCQILVLEWVGQSVMHTLRQNLFNHLLHLDLRFFNSHPTGRLVTRLTNDIQNMNEMFTSVIVTLFNDLLRLFGILGILLWMNVRLALVMSLFIPLALIITILFARLARERFRAIRTQLARLNSFLAETLAGISIIQLFGRQESNRQTFEDLSDGFLHRTLNQIKLFGTFMPLTEFMSSAAVAIILWYGGGEILQKQLTLGELVAFISYMRLFFQPLRELAQKYSVVQSAMASAERIFQLLDTKSDIVLPAQPVQMPKTAGRLEFDKIRFGYQPDTPILHDLSLVLISGTNSGSGGNNRFG